MATVDEIIASALSTALSKANTADSLSDTAMSAAQSFVAPSFDAQFELFPSDEGNHLDTTVYTTTYNLLIQELATRFTQFFEEYFPEEQLNVDMAAMLARDAQASEDAANWYTDALDPNKRGTGINRDAENAIWNSGVSRLQNQAASDIEAAEAAAAAAGYPSPPGALQAARDKINRHKWQQLGAVAAEAAKHSVDAERDNTRTALQNGWEREKAILQREKELRDYRLEALRAVAEYIRVISTPRQSAENMAIASAQQRAAMTNAAINLFAARSQHTMGVNKTSADMFYEMVRNVTHVATTLAQAAGQQAAAALNSTNTSVQQIVHLEQQV